MPLRGCVTCYVAHHAHPIAPRSCSRPPFAFGGGLSTLGRGCITIAPTHTCAVSLALLGGSHVPAEHPRTDLPGHDRAGPPGLRSVHRWVLDVAREHPRGEKNVVLLPRSTSAWPVVQHSLLLLAWPVVQHSDPLQQSAASSLCWTPKDSSRAGLLRGPVPMYQQVRPYGFKTATHHQGFVPPPPLRGASPP